MKLFPSQRSHNAPGRLIVLSAAALLFFVTAMLLCVSSLAPGKAHAAALVGTPTITPVSDPVFFVTSPTANSVFTIVQEPLLIPITAVAIAGTGQSVVQVSFTANATLIDIDTTSPYSVTWSVSTPGSYMLQITATLSNGSHLSSSAVPVTVQRAGVTPTPSTTPTPTSTLTPTPIPTSTQGAACSVQYVVTSQWPGGFSTNITIKDTGTTTLSGWTLQFRFADSQTITQLWNGSYTQSGSAITITNLSYNGVLAPGATANPGFNGTWSHTNTNPTAFTLNSVACSLN
ncbi:MAG TPA: cellulose binding domain-containing protein [Ktedonobacteraceae bacterium]|nr:cellulose binding domain-containing protein [Ktedonobacteraceae bacterium]